MTTRTIRLALAAVALAVAGAANAATINWGSITAPEEKTFAHYFDGWDTGYFLNKYNFSLTNEANSFVGLWEVDPRNNYLDITLGTVKLYKGGTFVGGFDSPGHFTFSDLSSGAYSLWVDGWVGWDDGRRHDDVGYVGKISFTAVPEPNTLALAGIGLLAVAFAMRRRFSN
jgi:hypothetical protein